MSRAHLGWIKRLFSTNKPLTLPASVFELLNSAEAPVQVQKVAGQGRGLFAARDLEYGEVLFSEQPYLCAPALSKRKQVCYHCLKVLGKGQAGEGLPTRAAAAQGGRGSRAFCSDSCLSAAQHSYYQLESQLNLGQLEQYCEAHGERFPLLAARLALMVAQQAMLTQPDPLAGAAAAGGKPLSSVSHISTASSSSMARSSLQASSWMSGNSNSSRRQGAGIGRLSARSSMEVQPAGGAGQQDPAAALSFLCFANVPPPPPAPWAAAHKLLQAALRQAADCREDPQEGQALAAVADDLDIDWYVAVLARLHLNTFKVDAVLPLDWDNPYAAAAAMVQADSSSGSALYLAASLFNHSCEPCVNVTFPSNDGTAVFTAARRISAGEQLFISYTDTEQEVDVRQEYLAFAYGFRCGCPKCRDDIEQLRKGMPLQP